MSTHIENICPDFFGFWVRAQSLTLTKQKRLWRDLYEDRHRDIFDIYYRRWGDPTQLEEALQKFPQVVPKVRNVVCDVEQKIKLIVANCAHVFEVSESDLSFVVMIGLFTSNGWVTIFRGAPTSFLALECSSGPRYLDILIAHEAAHNFHTRCHSSDDDFDTDFAIGEAVFKEGLAAITSAVIYPGEKEAGYLWFDSGYEGWMTACSNQWPELRQRFLRDLMWADEALYTAYFGGKATEVGLPKRAGYFVGYHAVAILNQRYSIAEMARWASERALAEVKQVLEEMIEARVEKSKADSTC